MQDTGYRLAYARVVDYAWAQGRVLLLLVLPLLDSLLANYEANKLRGRDGLLLCRKAKSQTRRSQSKTGPLRVTITIPHFTYRETQGASARASQRPRRRSRARTRVLERQVRQQKGVTCRASIRAQCARYDRVASPCDTILFLVASPLAPSHCSSAGMQAT